MLSAATIIAIPVLMVAGCMVEGLPGMAVYCLSGGAFVVTERSRQISMIRQLSAIGCGIKVNGPNGDICGGHREVARGVR